MSKGDLSWNLHWTPVLVPGTEGVKTQAELVQRLLDEGLRQPLPLLLWPLLPPSADSSLQGFHTFPQYSDFSPPVTEYLLRDQGKPRWTLLSSRARAMGSSA